MAFFQTKMEKRSGPLLEKGEQILLMIRQSLISDIAPAFIVGTNKRIIIINNSFWGLYANHNILTPTDSNIILYRQITSVMVVRGRIFSSVNIRILGGFESQMSAQKKTEGEIDGLWEKDAVKLAQFIDSRVSEKQRQEETGPEFMQKQAEKLNPRLSVHLKLYYAYKGILNGNDIAIKELDMDQAQALINTGRSKFVWLGTEPVSHIAELISVSEDRVLRLDPDEIEDLGRDIVKSFDGCVFMCYNGNVSKYVSKYLKKEHNIDSYSLKGGLVGAIKNPHIKAVV